MASQNLTQTPKFNSTYIRLIDWRWEEVKIFFAVVAFICVCGLAKIVFHRVKVISSKLPESCLLILLGIGFGSLIYNLDECQATIEDGIETNVLIHCKSESRKQLPQFSPMLFFFILLPPLILEASYSLHNKIFFNNFVIILIYAFIGTFPSFLLLGFLLLLINMFGLLSTARDLSPVQIFLFSSFISSVDPIAVLSIFSDLGINSRLYFLVFGESLLNDGMSVVLYNVFIVFTKMETNGQNISITEIFLGLVYFLSIVIGGIVIGSFFGILTSFLSKYTQRMKVVEPLMILCFAYLSYICAELFGWSGILSMIGCGLLQAHYAFKNICQQSLSSVKYCVKILSSSSECIIFLYLGAEIYGNFHWNWSFLCWSLLVCFLVRFVVVFGLSFLINKNQREGDKISFQEQFIIAYAGLRGAISFSLVLMINDDLFPEARMFKTTTLIIIIFTVFVQGGTIKYWVNLFNVKKKNNEEQWTILEATNDTIMEHLADGIGAIARVQDNKTVLRNFDKRYLKPLLIKTPVYNKLKAENVCEDLADHFVNLFGPSVIAMKEYEKSGQHNAPEKITLSTRRKFKRALSMNVNKTTFVNFSINDVVEENEISTPRHRNAQLIKDTIVNAFEDDFVTLDLKVNSPQFFRSVSVESHRQVDFSKIPVRARSGLALVMEKHQELKRTGTPKISVLEDKNTNLFFLKHD